MSDRVLANIKTLLYSISSGSAVKEGLGIGCAHQQRQRDQQHEQPSAGAGLMLYVLAGES